MPKWNLLCCLTIGSLMFAQDRGSIRGTVTDASGAPIADAVVTARNVNTGLTQSIPSSTDGVYNLLYLPAGGYIDTMYDKRKAVMLGIAGVGIAALLLCLTESIPAVYVALSLLSPPWWPCCCHC